MRAGRPEGLQPVGQAVWALVARVLGAAVEHHGAEADAETARTSVAPDGEVFQGRRGRLPRDPRRKVPLFEAEEFWVRPRVGADERAERGGEENTESFPAFGPAPGAGGGAAGCQLGVRVELRLLVVTGRVAVDKRGAVSVRAGGGPGRRAERHWHPEHGARHPPRNGPGTAAHRGCRGGWTGGRVGTGRGPEAGRPSATARSGSRCRAGSG